MQAVIVFENVWREGQRRWLARGERVTLGTSGLADVVIDEEGIMPFHLLVELREQGCALLAAPGAFFAVNGEHKTAAWLQHNDRIVVGHLRFRLELIGDEGLLGSPPPVGPPTVGPATGQMHIVEPKRVSGRPHDSQFVCLEPWSSEPWSAADMIAKLVDAVPVFGLSRFDPWAFPCPAPILDQIHSVPEAAKPTDARFLPQFFPLAAIEDPSALLRQGLDSQELMLFASPAGPNEVLAFLRSQSGLFLSPIAMQRLLAATEEGAVAAILGPIGGILVGTFEHWQLYCRPDLLADLATWITWEDPLPAADAVA